MVPFASYVSRGQSKLRLIFSRINGPIVSSSLRLGTKGVTCGKWFIGYNFGTDDDAESKFGTHKELIVLDYDRPLQFNKKLLGKT